MATPDSPFSDNGALARIPVTVLTGFLGAGKTTLLNALLREPHGFRVAVIVNEFGEVGIDGARIAGAEQFVQLDNGCLCCAINEDLKRTLAALRERGGFDHLVIETTGLADPLPVAWTFSRPNLGDFYRIDAIVTLADAVNLERALAEAPEAALQLERADLIVLSKVDLTADGGEAARARLRSIQPRAPILIAERGQIPWQILLTSRSANANPPSQARAAGATPGSSHAHAHSHSEANARAHQEHRPSFTSWVFRTRAVLDEDAVEDLLFALPEDVYRVKGLLRVDGEKPWILVNAVAGRFEIEPFEPVPAPDESALVFLGRDLDPDALRVLCARLA